MQGHDVYQVLKSKSIDYLYHANTVTTGCTFLQVGGLASRGYVADRRLPQTPQYTDHIDQKYRIWHDTFFDTVDIHYRARQRNQYGPVLFVIDLDILKALPSQSEVLVTKKNPLHWCDGEAEAARVFATPEELEDFHRTTQFGIKGTFGLIVMIRTRSGILPFPESTALVMVDDPQRALSNGQLAFSHALNRISRSSIRTGTTCTTKKHICQLGCRCVAEYQSLSDFDKLFM